MTNATSKISAEDRAALLSRSLRWLLIGWLLAAIFAFLALYQSVEAMRARRDASYAEMEADAAVTEAAHLRQQLEAERILARHEIEALRNAAQPDAPKP